MTPTPKLVRTYRRERVRVIVAGAAVIVVAALIAAWVNVQNIQARISSDVGASVMRAGFEGVDFTVSGRGVSLAGQVDATLDRQRLVEIIEELPGVLRVSDSRTVYDSGVRHPVVINAFGGVVSVRGEVASGDDADRILASVSRLYGRPPASFDLAINPTMAAQGWAPYFDDLLRTVRQVEPLTLVADHQNIALSGIVRTRLDKRALDQALQDLTRGEFVLQYRLRFSDDDPGPYLILEMRPDRLYAAGEVGSSDARDRLVANISEAFGEALSGADLGIADDVGDNLWREPVVQLLEPLARVKRLNLEASNLRIRVSGIVDTPGQLDAIEAAIRTAVPPTLMLDNRLILKAVRPSSRLILTTTDTAIRIEGELPDQASADRILRAARMVFEQDKIANRLTITEGVTMPAWLDDAADLFIVMAGHNDLSIALLDGRIIIGGRLSSDEKRRRLKETLDDITGDWQIEDRVQLSTVGEVSE